MLGRKCARELAQGLLVPFVRNLREVARKFETHAFAGAHRTTTLVVEAFEEVAHRDAQHPGDFEEPPCRHAVDATLLLVGLLVGHADQVGELLLRQAEHDSTFPDPGTDMPVDVLGPAGCPFHLRRTHGFQYGHKRGNCRGAAGRPTSRQGNMRSGETCVSPNPVETKDFLSTSWQGTRVGATSLDFNQTSRRCMRTKQDP